MPIQLSVLVKQVMQNVKYKGNTSDEELSNTIIRYGIFGAIGSGAFGIIPAGSVASVAVMTGVIWAMYVSISKQLGVGFDKGLLKAIASAVVSDVAGMFVSFGIAFAVSFFPGVGSGVSAAICAGSAFALVYVSGCVFLKLLSKLMGKDMEGISEKEIRKMAKDATNDTDVKEIVKEAKKVHKEVKNDEKYKDLSDVKAAVEGIEDN